jgi:hypothetical protein
LEEAGLSQQHLHDTWAGMPISIRVAMVGVGTMEESSRNVVHSRITNTGFPSDNASF